MLRPTFLIKMKPLASRPAIQFGALVLMFLSCVLPAHGDRVAFEDARQNPPEVRSLQPGQVVERELKGGETQLFRVSAEQGQFLRVVVEQRGIDIKLTVSGPDGQKLVEADAPTGEQGPETVSLLADVAGEHRIEVKSEDEKAKPGRYAARLEALRAATEADRNRVAAERTMREAEELSGQRDPAALRRAVQKYEEALQLWRVLNDPRGQAESLASIGSLYQVNLNEPRRAIDPYQQSLPLWRALSDRGGEAQALNNLGIIYNVLNEKQRALEYLNQALPLRRAAKDQLGEAITLTAHGRVYLGLGQKRRALDYYQRSLTLRRAAGDRAGETLVLNDIGVAYSDLGEMQKALDIYTQALPLRRDARGRAVTLNNLGRVYDILGAPEEALNYYSQSLQLVRSINEKRGEAQTVNFMGLARWAQGDYQRALDDFNAALKLRREVNDKAGEAAAFNNLGLVYTARGEQRQALEAYNQALPLLRESGNREGEAAALNNLGFVHEALGDPAQAYESHRQSAKLSEEIGDRRREAKARYGVARIERSRNRLREARSQIEKSVKIVESLRQKLVSSELRSTYRASAQQYYDLYIDVLMRMGKRAPRSGLVAEALQVSERARSRSLVELLTEASADIRQGADATLVERERELQEQLNEKTTEQIRLLGSRAKAEQIAAAGKEIDQLNRDLRDTQARIRTSSPRYASLIQPQPLTTREIQGLLDANTMLLEFSLGEERSYLWAVTPAAVHSFTLSKRATIEASAKRFYELTTARNQFLAKESDQQKQNRVAAADAESPAAAAELGRMLLAQVAPLLGKKRLVIVADGALQYVPFSALSVTPAKARYQPLVANNEVLFLPSATTLSVLRSEATEHQKAPKTVAVIADPVFEAKDERIKAVKISAVKDASAKPPQNAPPAETEPSRILLYKSGKESGAVDAEFRIPRLPNTRREAETILSLVPGDTGKSVSDFAASRAAATSEDLGQYRILHFATHGFLNSLNPELSGLVLSLVDEQGKPQNGYLLAPEIYNLKLPATELVVLSACQTGLGREVRGEGIVGLTRGFMYAGAPRVVVSLWSVNDRSTADLMKSFYEAMLAKGQRPSAALRSAQLALMKLRTWRSPYFWAAFGLQGEWR